MAFPKNLFVTEHIDEDDNIFYLLNTNADDTVMVGETVEVAVYKLHHIERLTGVVERERVEDE